jgi:flagellar hook assembly protein FlgD
LCRTNTTPPNVKIIIYDILGKEIKLVNNSVLTKGIHSFDWNGTDNNNNILSSGNYFVKVISESSIVTKRLVINK